jgi:eukaryotic translation initiation factor 2C
MELIKKLQNDVAPQVFTPHAVFDGRKNMFAARVLPLGPANAATVGNQCSSLNTNS